MTRIELLAAIEDVAYESGWRTADLGGPGFLLLARDGRVVIAWAAAAGEEIPVTAWEWLRALTGLDVGAVDVWHDGDTLAVFVWRPADLESGRVAGVLR